MSKIYEIAFALQGKINSSFGSSFVSASDKMKQLNSNVSSLKASMKELDQAQSRTAKEVENSVRALSKLKESYSQSVQKLLQLNQKIIQTKNSLKELNEQKKSGTITAKEFTARQAELVSQLRDSNSAYSELKAKAQSMKSEMQRLAEVEKQGKSSMQEYAQASKKLSDDLGKAEQAETRLAASMKLQNKLDTLKTKVDKLLPGIKALGKIGLVTGTAAAAGAGLVIGSSIGKAMDYESQMSSIQALTGLADDQMQKMSALALKMGADTKYSALEAAQGIEELLKAGISPATVQAGGLEAALNLATAGGLDLGKAAEIMSDALNGFKKDGMSAADAANILAGTANAASTDVESLQQGLAAVGPVADGIGVSFKEVNATLGAFSNNALKGSDAGTSLKTFLSNLQPTTDKAAKAFEQFGLTAKDGSNIFFDTNGQLKDMSQVAEILKEKFKDLNDQQRSAAFFQIFGSDAVRAANILYKEGADGIQEMYQEMSKVTALEVAKKKMDNAAGAVEQFKGALETLQISALTPTLPLIKNLALGAADFAEKYSPQITTAMQNAVDQAQAYFNTHFINNSQFQQIPDIKGKVVFVINDLLTEFNTWLSSGGQDQINQVGTTIIGIFTGVVEASAPKIAEAGAKVGAALGKALLKSFAEALQNSVLGSIVVGALGGAAMGSVILPGAGTLAGAVAGGISGLVTHAITGHANGGILESPHLGLVAEAGAEAIIPLTNRARGLEVWMQAGKALGVNMHASGGIFGSSLSTTSVNNNSGIVINVTAKFADIRMKDWLNANVYEPIKSVIDKASSWGKNLISQLVSGMEASRENLSAEVTKLTDLVEAKFKEGLGIASPSKMAFGIGRYVMQGLINGMSSVDIEKFTKDQMNNLVGAMGGTVSGDVTGWLTAALMVTGTPISWLPGLQRLVQAESGGNPGSINSQAVGSEHATGLLQTLPSTFREYAQNGMGNILNPVHNAAAAINYIKARYGSVFNTPLFRGGTYVGYAEGGFADRPSIFGEAGLEAAIPINGSSRSISLWQKAGEMLGMPKESVFSQFVKGQPAQSNLQASKNEFTFHINIAGGGNQQETKKALEEFIPELKATIEQIMDQRDRQRRRVSYA